jgi:type IV pilus assembly protein PilV
MDKQSTNQQGFTLIEILIAITIFSIGILAVATMQVSSIKGNSSANGLSEAVTLAQDKMEELMSLDYGDNDLLDVDLNGAAGLAETVNADGSNPGQGTNARYNVFWNIADNTPFSQTKTISVITTWTEEGRQRQVTLNCVKQEM